MGINDINGNRVLLNHRKLFINLTTNSQLTDQLFNNAGQNVDVNKLNINLIINYKD